MTVARLVGVIRPAPGTPKTLASAGLDAVGKGSKMPSVVRP